MKFMKSIISFLLLLLLVACGEDSTTEKIVQTDSSEFSVVSDVTELPTCSSKNDGEMVWVKNESAPRMCSDGKWYAVAEGSAAAACLTEPLEDGSGLKIVCGDDSVGVVLNGLDGKDGAQGIQGEKGEKGLPGNEGESFADGKDGANGKDGADGKPGVAGKDGHDGSDGKDGVNCFLEKMDVRTARVFCGNDSNILYMGEFPDTISQGEVVLDSEKIAIPLAQVSGVTQKGPFLSGSKVLVREMEDGRTLAQTGNSFNDKILNDKGEFKINGRMLVSQYVMLEVTGYYRNEVTGKNSKSELTMFAISDVNDRSTVNVNLLTHLEYERVIYLVTQKKMKVRAAKRQAQKEIFALLDIDATDFESSEDLNIAGSTEADAALLAFSVILQGERSESELSELLTAISTDIEKDGTWDDSTTRRALADWAFSIDDTVSYALDGSVHISNIRWTVEYWNSFSHAVPNFEKYVRKFWTKEYGLGECSDDVNPGEVVSAKRGPEMNRYICREGLWHVATDLEKDTYLWNDTIAGAIKQGNVTGKYYVHHPDWTTKWFEASEMELQLWGDCYEEIVGTYRWAQTEGEKRFYQCVNKGGDYVWEMLNEFNRYDYLKLDTQGWEDADDGDSRWGDSVGVVTQEDRRCYVYDTSAEYKGWRLGIWEDCGLGMQGCTESRNGLVLRANEGSFYRCEPGRKPIYGGFVSYSGYYWFVISENSRYIYNTYGWDCLDSNDGEMRLGQVNDVYFACENGSWRETSIEEELACRENGVCHITAE